MMQPGFVMPQQQGGQGGQGNGGGGMPVQQGFMMPQGGGNLQPGVQYMQMVLPMEQAKMMAANGVVPMWGKSPSGAQMQMMAQQGCKGGKGGKGGQGGPGFGMQGPAMANWGNQGKGFQVPVFNNGGKGKDADDGKLDDWLAKRMSGPSSSASASDVISQQMKPSPQQNRQPQQQMQPAPFGSQQMQAWQLPSINVQQQLQQQHEMQQQQQQLMWQQQQQWQWQQPQQHNMGMHSGSAGGNFGGDSPRTQAWKQSLAKSSTPAGEADVNDWISKRSEALAEGPAYRPPPRIQQPEELEDDSPQPTAIPWDLAAPLFQNTKPWADVVDTDEGLSKLMQLEEERKFQGDQVEQDEPRKAQPEVEPDNSLSAPTVSNEVVETATAPTEVVSESAVRSPVAKQEPNPDNEPPPIVVSEPTCSYAAAAKKTPKAAVTKSPTTATPPPATEVESTRSKPPVENATTKPADLLQKPTQDAPGSTAAASEETPAPQQSSKSETDKKRKGLEKKLRQIADLEKKAADGIVLDAEATKKVASKATLEAELKQLS